MTDMEQASPQKGADDARWVRIGQRLREARLRLNLSQETLAEMMGAGVRTIRRWEQGDAFPYPHFREQLCQLFQMDAQTLFEVGKGKDQQPNHIPTFDTRNTLPIPDQQAPLWHIPYPRNPFFTGREELLRQLRDMLHREHTMTLTQSLAISGLGGIGKTQIALEYAYQHQQEYRFVFWASAATQETLLADFVSIAERLQLPERTEQHHQKVVKAVKQWFATHHEWLLILDNADDMALVYDFLPTNSSGHLLLTSRAQALGALAQRLDVEKMGMVEGTLFLLHRAKILAPDVFLDRASEADLAAVEAIVIEMDFLPLALDQAGAYIEDVGCSLSTYLELYRTRRRELLQRRGSLSSDHPEPVATTWSLSFQHIEQANPAAAELLRLCAFLEPDAIPEEVLSEGCADLGPVLQSITTDILRLNDAIEILRKYSLVQRDPEAKLLRIHRLVQAVLKDSMEARDQQRWAERAVQAIHAVFPQSVEQATWLRCRRFLPQAQVCSVLIENFAFVTAEATSLLMRTASYLQDAALYEQAEPLLKRALQIREQTLGAEHPDVAELLSALGNLTYLQGNYGRAEELYQRAVQMWEQTLGPEHPRIAEMLNGLATQHLEQGNYAEGEVLLQRALRIWEQALGAEHQQMADVQNTLGRLYNQQGRYAEAELVLKQAVSIREQALGTEHFLVSHPLNNLGISYNEQGKYAEAEPVLTRALCIREQALGVKHPQVALPLMNLGITYYEQGRYAEAEPLLIRALHIKEQSLGVDHPKVAYTLTNLGLVYYEQERYAEAEPLYQRAVQIREHALGVDHPQVAYPLGFLGNLYRKQGKYQEAELLLTRSLHIKEQALGTEHADLAESLFHLACLSLLQHHPLQAQHYYQQALAIWEKTLGREHAQVISSLEEYEQLMREQARK